MAISIITVWWFSFAQESDWIEHDVDAWTVTVYSADGSYGIVIQDKNLWATEVWGWTWASTWSYGCYYQWWNNYCFPSDPNATITISSTKVDASDYWPENPYSSGTFIKRPANYNKRTSDWSSVRNDNLRWWTWDNEDNWWGLESNNPITGRQWPCPEWWHVPSVWEIDEFVVMWYNHKYNADLPAWALINSDTLQEEGINVAADFSNDIFMPFASIRWWDDWTLPTYYYNIAGQFWSSTPFSGMWHTLSFTLRNGKSGLIKNAAYLADDNYRSTAMSVRCFKNERVYREVSKALTLNVMSGESVVSTWVSFTDDESLTSGQVLWAIEWLASEVELSSWYHFTWYTETGWAETEFDLDTAISEGTITSSLTLTWRIEANKYTISFLDENGSEIMSGEFTYDQEANLPANTSTKEWYTFKWWKDGQWNTYEDGATVKNLTTENGATLEFSPIREENSKPSGGGSSWWGGRWRGSKAVDSQTDTHWAADDEKTDSDSKTNNNEDTDGLEVVNYNPDLPAEQQTLSDGLTPEMHRAYKFAFKHGITTMPTILEADMFGPLDRISMAKMLSQYAINVLWKTPDTNIEVPAFPDISPELNEQFWNAVTLAYQLWIMWINIDKFRPFDLVPRSEFGTALSRMLYQTSDWIYEKTDEYYTPHFEKLKEEGIMSVFDPYMKELRWYVMIMLMRSAEKNN